ncbi:MAG: anaerobic sulfatase maturase [Betaproteobacteria bacterium]|nr:anaerobic sulfatase maturase [Betaproteobacteria bacterium]
MLRASREFQVFTKPIGAACNLDCRYCYYLEKRHLYPATAPLRMPDELLEAYIAQHIQACPISTVHFSWHGGEPTLLGVEYFRKIVALQRKHRIAGREIINGIQTNGTLLDEEWCRFLAAEDFYVGLSLDGPEELHDRYRVAKSGIPTHAQVMNGFRLMQRHRVHCDILCVVHDFNVRHPMAVYRYFKQVGARYLVFIPLVKRAEAGGVTPESVPAEEYGAFLCAIFEEWIREDISRMYVQIFDEAARPLRGLEHSVCTLRRTCGELPVLEHTGDLYSCDHYVDRDHCLGNIAEKPLVELLESPAQRSFGQSKWDSLPQSCRRCKVLEFCNGGCPKDRFITTRDGEPGLNYLCAGFHRFLTHARPHLRRLAAFIQTGQPIERFSELVRSGYATSSAPAGRNDPCPCGSGKKFKKCCGRSG